MLKQLHGSLLALSIGEKWNHQPIENLHPWPSPLQTGINTKKLNLSLIDEVFLYLFPKFSEQIDAEKVAAGGWWLPTWMPCLSLSLSRPLTGLRPKVISYKKTTQKAQ